MKYKTLSCLLMAFLSACTTVPKAQPVTLSCYAEQTYDFIAKQGGKNYWAEMVTEKTLQSCRDVNYQKHTAYLTPEQIKQAKAWVTSRELN